MVARRSPTPRLHSVARHILSVLTDTSEVPSVFADVRTSGTAGHYAHRRCLPPLLHSVARHTQGMPGTGFTHESPHLESVEWYTPPEIISALAVRFDLDPCSPGQGKSFVPADHVLTAEDDGLTSPWFGKVFVNPPYGRATADWMRKCRDHGVAGGEAIALVFSRTDTGWFQEIAPTLGAACFVSGRIHFFQGDLTTRGGSPGTGSMLLAWGPASTRAVLASGLGVCFQPY